MKAKIFGRGSWALGLLALLTACGGELPSIGGANTEIVHAVGDLMGAADESLSQSTLTSIAVSAFASSSCYSTSFSPCSSNQRTLTYSQCTFGSLTLSGEVQFVFAGGSNCSVDSSSEFVRRVPDFEIVGRSGGTVGVVTLNPSSGGQTITNTGSSTYSYQVSGIRRYFEDSNSTRTVDISVNTTTAIQISGSTRATRQMSGGTLVVSDNLDGSSVSMSPNALRWTSRCSCATSGSWIGQKTDATGLVQDFVVELTGCGTANVTVGVDEASIKLERCIGL